MRVGYVRVAFTDSDYAKVPESNKSFSQLKAIRRLPDSDPDSGIHPSLAPQPGDISVRKTRVGAFSTTDLAEQLSRHNIDTLVLAGVSTSGVVLSTLRYAADRDYRLYVLEDCCADADEEVHRVLMQKVFPRQADVIASTQFTQLLSNT
jgi:nicotinamidase-related amidase